MSPQGLDSKDKLPLISLQCIFFWQSEINSFITEMLLAVHICYGSTVFMCIFCSLRSTRVCCNKTPTAIYWHRPQYVIRMKAINAMRESETWVTAVQSYSAVCLLLFGTNHYGSVFLGPLNVGIKQLWFYFIELGELSRNLRYEIFSRDNLKERQNMKMDIGLSQV